MKFRSRILILSSLAITMSLVIITLSTFALFTDNIRITHHLQAGTLDATLKRVKLEYNILASSGYLKEMKSDDILDLSNTTSNKLNVFGISDETLLVPGNYYDATFELSNNGDVAFKYWIEVFTNDDVLSDLAGQMEIKVTTYDKSGFEKEHTAFISEGLFIGSETLPLGELTINNESVRFKVKITFIDSVLNNDAKSDKVNFDIIVYAVQSIN